MAAILVVEDYELKLILRALDNYKEGLHYEDDFNDEYDQAKKIINRIKTIKIKKRKDGQEL